MIVGKFFYKIVYCSGVVKLVFPRGSPALGVKLVRQEVRVIQTDMGHGINLYTLIAYQKREGLQPLQIHPLNFLNQRTIKPPNEYKIFTL